ncbi:helix-turn-helix domain-containing protein [Chromobacterium violaceum]|uniref:LacI family transcriptional regulator n=1 Tax=Chromobacterium violaceum TaxID=536 RepID=A0AAX2M9I4_CHRVL|nr:helix-turn-helix transcriptional regulator [Chromobacterium violaceum]OLZ77068.1 hypothetical protein BS642_15015 [Chromobacterium violaceum]STB70898.1 Uncharacterised protein [Chromobacterium violaceum]STB71616.1 Uncharacterised protein [Chromobacterium violaceum]SUX31400.1 Uncharacterised protein [Chromobacterium violaceum]SUX33035.1 Uncharacterised protein [Chromobacterium violaceum]
MTTISEPLWLPLLRAEVGRTSIGQAAKLLGYSRTTVSLVLAGKYPGQTERVAEVVLHTLGRVACPYLGRDLTPDECKAQSTSQAPTHNPLKLAHWRACQQCQNRCKGE